MVSICCNTDSIFYYWSDHTEYAASLLCCSDVIHYVIGGPGKKVLPLQRKTVVGTVITFLETVEFVNLSTRVIIFVRLALLQSSSPFEEGSVHILSLTDKLPDIFQSELIVRVLIF
jgi:hypothetical protein